MPKRRFLILIVVLVLIALGAGAYFYFRPQITDWVAGITGGEEGEETDEEVGCEGQTYANPRQGYEVCYPIGWYTQEFGYSQLWVGFDAFPIPTASEYPGVFSIGVSRQGSSAALAPHLANLMNTETTTLTVSEVPGIRVYGTISADDNFFPNYHEVAVVLEKFGRTYDIVMLSAPDAYAENLPIYDAFAASLKFLDGTPAAPWGRDIYLDTPWPNDEVSASFRIAGSAQGAFENTLVVRLVTVEGTVLLQDPVIYNAPEMGELGYFDVPVTFSTSSKSGTLEVYHTSPKDGAILDLVSVPLQFK